MTIKTTVAVLSAIAAVAIGAGVATAVKQPGYASRLGEFDLKSGELAVPPSGGAVTQQVPREMRQLHQAFQSEMVAEVGAEWRVSYDHTTGVPSRMFGRGVHVPNAVRDPQAAEQFARAFLARHLEFLAPGASIDDMVLVDNVEIERGAARHVGFAQHHAGMPIVGGGGVTFYFKNDRLATITSESMPNVTVDTAQSVRAPANARLEAANWMGASLNMAVTDGDVVGEPKGPFVLPIIKGSSFSRAHISYRTVYQVAVHTAQPITGYDVFVDAVTGEALARRQTTLFADGTVGWELGKRRIGTELQFVAARNTDTSSGTTDADGVVDVGGGGNITLRTEGPLVQISNRNGSSVVSSTVSASPGAESAASAPTGVNDYAAVNTFAYLNFVFEYARKLNPSLGQLDVQMTAVVNQSNTCNAFYGGWQTNFFSRGGGCENTGALSDVVMHEFGHGLHQYSLLGGVRFDGALSEAHGDILATTIAGEPNLGEGFFMDTPDRGLRELDPPSDKIYPDDVVGQVHTDGEIYGGTMWDLRKAFVAKHGEAAGVEKFNQVWYDSMRRANNMQSADVHIFEADDDDGDITNGTPNACIIAAALDAHGLLQSVDGNTPTSAIIGTPTVDGLTVSMTVETPEGDCVVAEAQSATLRWQLRDDPNTAGEVDMTGNATGFTGMLPSQPNGTVVNYQIEVALSDGNTARLPRNPADPWYELYLGPVEEIYCANMDSDPGFTTGGAGDDWSYGPAVAGAGDPGAAFTGANVFGQSLGGAYDPDVNTYAEFTVDGLANYENVRLQYRRWLTVEDSTYDQAEILVNGTQAWVNIATATDPQSGAGSTQHEDREWRFQDVPLDGYLDGSGSATIRFALTSDPGLEFGGWTLDDVCIVAAASGPLCGNGQVEADEQCDDGNTVDGDGCSATCEDESGDGGGDGGGGADGDETGGCGCAATGDPASTAGGLLLMLGVALLMRRRRRG